MSDQAFLPGVQAATIATPHLRTFALAAGDQDGTPIIFIHGNVSSGRFWEETLAALPAGYRGLAPDLRGYGESETLLESMRRAAWAISPTISTRWSKPSASARSISSGGRSAATWRCNTAIDRADRFADPGRGRLALRLRRHQGPRWHPDLARLCRIGRRHRQSRIRATARGGRPQRRQPGVAAQRDEPSTSSPLSSPRPREELYVTALLQNQNRAGQLSAT